MAKKEVRSTIYFICSQCHNKNYTSEKNTLNTKDKLELKKYCPTCKAHTVHTEGKK